MYNSYMGAALFGLFLGGCIWGLIPLIIGICKKRWGLGLLFMVLCGVSAWFAGGAPFVLGILTGFCLLGMRDKNEPPEDPDAWVCGACVTKNAGADVVCKRCGKSKPGTSGAQPQEREKESLQEPVSQVSTNEPGNDEPYLNAQVSQQEASRPTVYNAPVLSAPVPPQTLQHNAFVTVTTGPMAGRQFRCRPGTVVIAGRDPSKCNLVLGQYNAVSGAHCRIEIQDQRILVTDLQSTNGTYFNGSRLPVNQPVPLGNQAVLQLGSGACTVRIEFQ